jgi:carboxyl-terminal processing protease
VLDKNIRCDSSKIIKEIIEMRHNVKKVIVGVMCGISCMSLMGCSISGKEQSRTGILGSSSSSETVTDLDYAGSVVDQDTLDKVASLESIIDSAYYFETSDEDLKNGLYAGLIEALDDPYAKYYTAEEYAKLQEDNSGEYAGIGVVVRQDADTGYVLVVSITDDSPANDVDLLPDDYIVQIDDYEIQSSDDLDYLVTLIRGEEGTDVTLKVYRASDYKYHDVTITRKKIENKTVSYFMIDDEIGYVRVSQFVSNTKDLFREAVEDLESQGMKAMMIDLRSNPGGMLNVVVDMCDFLLPAGKIVYQEDKNGNVLSTYESTDEEQYTNPMVVLTNGESASASEIMTAALKEYGLATIVGENTFGKGIVQTVIPLSDGSAVKLTTAKYFTPNGNDIHGIGVAPDIEVSLPDDYTSDDFQGENDSQYQKGIEVLKEKLGE